MRLRQLKEKDAEGMLEWMHNEKIAKNFRFDTMKRTRDDVLDFIHNAAKSELAEGTSLHYAIVNDDDDYLGTISLKNISVINRNAEYAISLREKAQGHGIATMATKKLLHIAFTELGLQRIYLNVLSENERAIHLYEKCGFIYEGEFRKHLLLSGEYKTLKWYSVLSEEYSKF